MSVKLGLVGHPVSHSLSPPLHGAALSFFGIAGSYELIDLSPAELSRGIDRLIKDGFSGFNVTIPHKEAVFALLEKHSFESRLVGAVNTVRIDSAGHLSAHNTDLGGFIQALSFALGKADRTSLSEANIQANCFTNAYRCRLFAGNEKVLLVGAGGAARACLAGLIMSGCRHIVVAARNPDTSRELCKSVCTGVSSYLDTGTCNLTVETLDSITGCHDFSLAVNCTPVGLTVSEAPWAAALINSLSREALLFDNVYRQDGRPTFLMRLALERGLSCVDGLDLLVEQAALSFEYWTGRRPPAACLRESLHNRCQMENGSS